MHASCKVFDRPEEQVYDWARSWQAGGFIDDPPDSLRTGGCAPRSAGLAEDLGCRPPRLQLQMHLHVVR